MTSSRRILSLAGAAALLATPALSAQQDSSLFARISPGVVILTAYDASGARLRKGSGFAIDEAGIIVTNQHVIDNAAVVEVKTHDQATHYASALLGSLPAWDLALLKVEPGILPALALASDELPKISTPVHVVGSAVSLKNNLFSGIVSGAREHDGTDRLLEITNQLYAVTSGAPVLGDDGEVLGVAIFGGGLAQNQNFAVPAKVLRGLLDREGAFAVTQQLQPLSEDDKRRVEEAEVLRNQVLAECAANDVVNTDRVIKEAILVGAPIYNTGDHIACFKIYEGASYKLLYLLGDRCPTASGILSDAIVRSARAQSPARSAWAMRYAFDSLLGVPTQEGRDEGPGL